MISIMLIPSLSHICDDISSQKCNQEALLPHGIVITESISIYHKIYDIVVIYHLMKSPHLTIAPAIVSLLAHVVDAT